MKIIKVQTMSWKKIKNKMAKKIEKNLIKK